MRLYRSVGSATELSALPLRNWPWAAWLHYDRRCRIQRGKYRTARMLMAAAGLPVASVRGVRMELFPPSTIDGALLEEGDFDVIVREAIDEFLGPGDVFLDIGANIGWFSVYAAVTRQAEVWAFEPSPRECARLRRNAALNGCSVRLFPFALGSAEGLLPFELGGDGNPGANRILKTDASQGGGLSEVRRAETVLPVKTLRRVRLVKIDVEGWEVEVLRGFGSAFDALADAAFVVEVSPSWLARNGSSAEELYGILEERGWRPRSETGSGEQRDVLFLRRDRSRGQR